MLMSVKESYESVNVSEGESQVEWSGPQPTGCPFRSAVSALVARHAHVGGDPLQGNVGATSNEPVAHDDYFFNDVFSRRLTVVFDGLQRRQRVKKTHTPDTAIGG